MSVMNSCDGSSSLWIPLTTVCDSNGQRNRLATRTKLGETQRKELQHEMEGTPDSDGLHASGSRCQGGCRQARLGHAARPLGDGFVRARWQSNAGRGGENV